MFNNFKLASFVFEMTAIDPVGLPEYKGSTFRGAFGHSFKKTVCALKNKECTHCLLKEKCIYSYIFETPPPAGTAIMKKYTAAPHPFIIEPPLENKQVYKPDEPITLGLILIGKAIEYLPYFIYTFNELGQTGIGAGKGKFSLNRVLRADTSEPVYETSTGTLTNTAVSASAQQLIEKCTDVKATEITLNFLTPTRIKYGEELTVDLEFHMLLRSLLRRFSTLAYFHCNYQPDLDFKGLIQESAGIAIKNNSLEWHDWERYSNRQHTRMKMGGLMGEVTFTGELIPFLPFLRLGETIHVGKGTSFGLGKYLLRTNGKKRSD